jgi:putative restriction endonuclease
VLAEEDGPMRLHGLKEMHYRQILLPRCVAQHPDRERLAERYAAFRAAAGGL